MNKQLIIFIILFVVSLAGLILSAHSTLNILFESSRTTKAIEKLDRFLDE